MTEAASTLQFWLYAYQISARMLKLSFIHTARCFSSHISTISPMLLNYNAIRYRHTLIIMSFSFFLVSLYMYFVVCLVLSTLCLEKRTDVH